MNVKTGTQTWSKAEQRTDFKSDGSQTMSASDRGKLFQGDAVGDTLNKVADPNYIDTSKKMRTVGNAELGKDAFMTLLLTQMKNQDPTSPLQSHEMAAQLAQFTSLEKLSNIDTGIESLRKEAKPDQNLQALSFIGKMVTTDNSKVTRGDLNETHAVGFNLPADATTMTVNIKNANGDVVRKLDFKALKAGKNEINWNGKTDDGTSAPVGEYTADFEAKNSSGKKLYVESKVEGQITGVNFTAQGPLLMIGRQAVSMNEVKTITDPGLMEAPQQTQDLGAMMGAGAGGLPAGLGAALGKMGMSVGGQAPQQPQQPQPVKQPEKAEVKKETKGNEAVRSKLSSGTLNDLAMTSGLINKLNKEGAKAGGY